MAHPLRGKVEEQVKSNPIMIYMKGTPEFPQCGFSSRAVQVLRAAGAQKMASVNVLENDDLWEALEEYSEWPTVPQIFIGGQFVGGCDIVTDLYQKGELQGMLQNAQK